MFKNNGGQRQAGQKSLWRPASTVGDSGTQAGEVTAWALDSKSDMRVCQESVSGAAASVPGEAVRVLCVERANVTRTHAASSLALK